MRILALEPYYGGSHRHVLDGLVERTSADWTLVTLPARKWKWRMRGSAITMADEVSIIAESRGDSAFDLVFASTFVNLAEFRGLAPAVRDVPAIVYFHENQLVYPNRHTADWDYQFPLTNITSALSAEHCVFNSEWNRREFLEAIPAFIREFPDHRPAGLADKIARKSSVLAPPFDPAAFDDVGTAKRSERCRIVWPHRWEHDKNPGEFFAAVRKLAEEGLDFEVVVAGQSFPDTVEEMRRDAEALGSRLVHCGQPNSRAEYARLLASCDVAVSTALNEFFGIAMVEACYAGCYPVVPRRLAYPELYGPDHLYSSTDELVARLRALVLHRPAPGAARSLAERYTFEQLVPRYVALFEQVSALS